MLLLGAATDRVTDNRPHTKIKKSGHDHEFHA